MKNNIQKMNLNTNIKKQYLYDTDSSKIILNQLSYKHEVNKEPYILKIKNGIVLPRKIIVNKNSYQSLGGVLSEDFQFIKESMEYDFGGGYDFSSEVVEKRNEKVIYLGRGFPHYGVIMIDFIRRLYYKYTEEGKNLKLCYCGIYSDIGTFGKADKRSWELLEDMGIHRTDVIDVRKVMQFDMVYIPEPGFEYEKYYHKEFYIPYKIIYDKVKAKDAKKIYLSRKKMSSKKEAGENIIEEFFSINGFKVIYPDELSIYEQVEWLKGADVIASIEGTISHNILFCKKGTEQIVIRKYTRIEPRHFLLNELMDSKATYIDCMFNFMPGFPRHYDIGPFCILFNKNIRNFAKDSNYVLPKKWFISNIITIINYCKLCFHQVCQEKK